MNVTLLKNNCQKRFKALHFSVGSENNQLMMMMLTKLANLMIDNLDLQIQQKGQKYRRKLNKQNGMTAQRNVSQKCICYPDKITSRQPSAAYSNIS